MFLGATAISILSVLEDYSSYLVNDYNFDYSWFTVPLKAVSNNFSWILFAPIIFFGAKGIINRDKGNYWTCIAFQIFLSIIISIVHRLCAIVAFDAIYALKSGFWANPLSIKNQQLLLSGAISSLIQYWIIAGIFLSIIYYHQYLDKQKELNQAQLQALKMQLHPHFLFNTLHSISSLIDINKKDAQTMLSRLGNLLRTTLETENKNEASLKEEINFIQDYLNIEHIRFQDRLEIHYDIPDLAYKARMPYLILQPIVENAIKHGIRDMQEKGMIKVGASIENNRIVITIEDNGVSGKNSVASIGLGLNNVRKRLVQFYADDFDLITRPKVNHGYEVILNLPFQTIT